MFNYVRIGTDLLESREAYFYFISKPQKISFWLIYMTHTHVFVSWENKMPQLIDSVADEFSLSTIPISHSVAFVFQSNLGHYKLCAHFFSI